MAFFIHGFGILLQDCRSHHILTVVTEEHLVGNDIRADFQLCCRILFGIVITQGSAVTATVDGTANNGRMIFVCSFYTDRYRLSIGAEVVEGLNRCFSCNLIIVVAKEQAVFQVWIIGIGIRAVTAAIDAAANAGIDTHGIAAIDLSCDIVTTIDVVDVTATNQHTG